MDTGTLLEFGLIIFLILLNAFFAGSEMALIKVRKSTLKDLVEKRARGARSALRLIENPNRFLATIQVGITVAGMFASALGAIAGVAFVADWLEATGIPIVAQNSNAIALVGVTGVIVFLTLVVGELVPKNLALHFSERLALWVSPPLDLLSRVASPLIQLLTLTTNLVLRVFGIRADVKMSSVSLEEIESMVDMGEEEGVLQTSKADMIHGIFELSETRVREIMVPRIDIVAVQIDGSVDECLRVFTESGHSRLPVYTESVDNVVGLVQAKDFLPHFGNGRDITVKSLMRPALYVPEGKRVDELMQEMKRTRSHFALVVDEFGGTAGVVTLEDIVEEVVGEIEDEYDLPETNIEMISENELVTSGKMGIDEINERLEIDLQKHDFDSIGGLVMNELGRLPVTGDTITLDEATVEVLGMANRRIKRVRVRRVAPKAAIGEEPLADSG